MQHSKRGNRLLSKVTLGALTSLVPATEDGNQDIGDGRGHKSDAGREKGTTSLRRARSGATGQSELLH